MEQRLRLDVEVSTAPQRTIVQAASPETPMCGLAVAVAPSLCFRSMKPWLAGALTRPTRIGENVDC